MQCLLCNSTKQVIVRDTLRYGVKRKVLRCALCSFEFLEPLKQIGEDYYSSTRYRSNHGPNLRKISTSQEIFQTYLPYQQKIIQELEREKIISPRTRVLDVGCSTGHLLAALKGRVGKRVGLELDASAAAFIKKHLDFPVYETPIEKAEIREGPFDLITSIETLEHISDPLPFLHGIGRQLAKTGQVYIEVPNLNDALMSLYQVKEYVDFYYREPHVSYFTERSLMRLMKKAGFTGRVKTAQRYYFLNHMHWWLMRKPQDNFTLAMEGPELVQKKKTKALEIFLEETNERYKKLLQKQGAGDILIFLGTRTP